MADARALLRQQRAARQQAQTPRKPSAVPATAPISRKRKADLDENEEKKRTRTEEAAGVPAGFFDPRTTQDDENLDGAISQDDQITESLSVENPKLIESTVQAGADAELDAFMDEMSRERPLDAQASIYSNAAIEAAPMTAAEITAQAREEQIVQRARKDEEMEGEKEDAARALEDEVEEMNELEARVRKLREQREALRTKSRHIAPITAAPIAPVESDDDESEDDEWDDWRFHLAS